MTPVGDFPKSPIGSSGPPSFYYGGFQVDVVGDTFLYTPTLGKVCGCFFFQTRDSLCMHLYVALSTVELVILATNNSSVAPLSTDLATFYFSNFTLLIVQVESTYRMIHKIG